MLLVPLFGRDSMYVYIRTGCWVTQGQELVLWKTVLNEKGVVASQIILLPDSHICVIYSNAHALPHLSLISECLNLRCSVERLPADTQLQIKSFTVESKEFSLSLHKHEGNGGGGLR